MDWFNHQLDEIAMVILSPQRIGLWDRFQMASGGPNHLQVVDPPSRKLKHQHVNMEPPKKTPGKGGSSLKPSWASGSICQSLGGLH